MVNLIQGGISKDHRGQIRYVNGFDMTEVRRFYIIKNSDLNLVRGWRAHQVEQRWFYIVSGSFSIDLVKIDNWEHASSELPVERHILTTESMQILYVPKGYGTALQAIEPNSELLVFADFPLSNATNDNYTWDENYFLQRLK